MDDQVGVPVCRHGGAGSMNGGLRLALGALVLAAAALAGRAVLGDGGIMSMATVGPREVEARAPGGPGNTVSTSLASASPARGSEAVAEPASIPLQAAIDRIGRCAEQAEPAGDACPTVVYFWSARMPLSAEGVSEIGAAAEGLGARLMVVRAEELESQAGAPATGAAADMLAAGATLHYPSLLVYRDGRPSGKAILGFKRSEAYAAMIAERLASPSPAPPTLFPAPAADDTLTLSVEFAAEGRAGAYFRAVPGRQTLVYEASSTIHLLDLRVGSTSVGPGSIDFVPSPDGRIFVTPGRNGTGLEFYDAAEVFAEAARGAGKAVDPVYVDPTLRDQYPSVGVLRTEGERTVYRVLTSWFDGIAFRDYEVAPDRRGVLRVSPVGERTSACRRVSIPILSPDGREVAGRDEAAGTTKIYRLSDGDACAEVLDLGVPSGKVAWSPDGRRVAFAVPEGALRDGSGTLSGGARSMAGIFVYDRDPRTRLRLPGSEDAHRLSFPEFVGSDSLVYLVTPPGRGRPSVFRLVCCVN